MQQHSTGYIIGFSAAICVVCALFVAGSAVSLKERQERNALIDKQTNVLAVAGLIADGQKLSSEEVEQIFSESIQARVIDMATGDENASIASDSFDQRRAAKDPAMSTPAPSNRSRVLRIPNQGLIYEVRKDGRLDAVIIPIEGMGLWSILYGYIALAPDATTIRGITYYEQKETAGLGGEVENPSWKAKWVGRRAFDERGNVKIEVKKGIAGPPDLDPYRVDGLAGATLTSRGVTNMLRFWLGDDGFGPYLAKLRDSQAAQGG